MTILYIGMYALFVLIALLCLIFGISYVIRRSHLLDCDAWQKFSDFMCGAVLWCVRAFFIVEGGCVLYIVYRGIMAICAK